MSLLTDLDAFYRDHRKRGDLCAGVDECGGESVRVRLQREDRASVGRAARLSERCE